MWCAWGPPAAGCFSPTEPHFEQPQDDNCLPATAPQKKWQSDYFLLLCVLVCLLHTTFNPSSFSHRCHSARVCSFSHRNHHLHAISACASNSKRASGTQRTTVLRVRTGRRREVMWKGRNWRRKVCDCCSNQRTLKAEANKSFTQNQCLGGCCPNVTRWWIITQTLI